MSDCNPNDLLSGQIVGLDEAQKEALITELLFRISGAESVDEVLDSASCFACLTPEQIEALKTELLCRISQ